MELPTHITSKSKGTIAIKDMAWTHLSNTIKKMERDHSEAQLAANLEYLALIAELESRPAPEADAGTAGSTVDEARAVHAQTISTGSNSMPNPREVIGGNNPPSEADRIRTDETNLELKVEVDKLVKQAAALPAKIETDAQHELCVTFGTTAASLAKRIVARHVVVKAPYKEGADAADLFFLTRGLKGALETVAGTVALKDGAYLERLEQERREKAMREAAAAESASERLMEKAAEAEASGEHLSAEVLQESAIHHETKAAEIASTLEAPAGAFSRTFSSAGQAKGKKTAEPVVDRKTLDFEAIREFISDDAITAALKALAKLRKWEADDLAAGKYPIKGVTWTATTKAQYRP